MSEVSLIHHIQKERATKFVMIRVHSVCLSAVEKNSKQKVLSLMKKILPPSCFLFFFKNSIIVQILVWPQLLQIFSGGNTTFPSLFTANMTVGSVSCCKKLMCFQVDHMRTPTWRDRFCSQYHQRHYSPLNKEKSNFQEHPVLPMALTQQQPRSMGLGCLWSTWSWPGPVPAQPKHHHKLETADTSTTSSESGHLFAKVTSCILHQLFTKQCTAVCCRASNFWSFDGKVVLQASKRQEEKFLQVLFIKQHRRSRRRKEMSRCL